MAKKESITAAQPEELDISQVIDGLTALMNQENNTMWEQGDFLVHAHLSAEGIVKVAEHFQRKPSTLVERERIAREFPVEIRDPNIAFGLYRTLMRIPTTTERLHLLNSKPHSEWTHTTMLSAVRQYLRRLGPAEPTLRHHYRTAVYKGGVRLGDLKVGLSLSEQGLLEILIDAPTEEPQHKVHGTQSVLFMLVNPPGDD